MRLYGDSMLIKPTLRAYLIEHSQNGEWSGAEQNGIAVVTTHNGVEPAEPYLNHLGIKLNKTNKYTGVKNEDMGKTFHYGDSTESRDGISQSAE